MTEPAFDDILPAVAGIVPTTDDRLLFVHNEVFDAWTLPMTAVEPGVSLETALRNEVETAAGLTADPVELTGVYSDPNVQAVQYESGELVHYVTTCYRCRPVRAPPSLNGYPDAELFSIANHPYLGYMQQWLDDGLDAE
jgi:ADP-ribose pyrophosphatase YjhB (NUDIX family)